MVAQEIKQHDCDVDAGAGKSKGRQPAGPGALMWHASAQIFDRFLVIHGGRQSPPSLCTSVDKAAALRQEAHGKCSLAQDVHIFDICTVRLPPATPPTA